MLNSFYYTAILVFSLLIIFYLWGVFKKDHSLIKFLWPINFFIVSLVNLSINFHLNVRQFFLFIFVLIWAIHLVFYFFLSKKEKSELEPFIGWRQIWGEKNFNIKILYRYYLPHFIYVFLVSTIFIFIFNSVNTSISFFDYLLFIFLLLVLILQIIADWQLYNFKQEVGFRESVLTEGLWQFCRHPNYFFEWMFWLLICLYSLKIEYGWFTFIPFVVLTYYFINIDIKLMEKTFNTNRAYDMYKQQNNKFFPWFKSY